jgi:hypothetical protein
MKAALIPDRITPLTTREVLRAFRDAFQVVCGFTPSNATLALLVAHSALETGRWKSIHCYNFGNVKAGPDYEGYYCQFRCNEVLNGKTVWFDPPHAQCSFRAFGTITEGAADHLEFLARRPRYAKAWQVMLAGDPARFVDELKAAHYFTADAEPYKRAVTSLWREYMNLLADEEPEEREPDTDPDFDAIRRTVAAQQFDTHELIYGAEEVDDGKTKDD